MSDRTPSLLVTSACAYLALVLVAASQPLAYWRASWAHSLPLVVGLAVTSIALILAVSRWVKEENR